MLRVKVGGVVLAPRHPGETMLHPAAVVVIMPQLVIVEFADGLRHCVPHSACRPA